MSSAQPSGERPAGSTSRSNALRITSSGAPNCNAMLQTTAASLAAQFALRTGLCIADENFCETTAVSEPRTVARYFRSLHRNENVSLGRRFGRRWRRMIMRPRS